MAIGLENLSVDVFAGKRLSCSVIILSSSFMKLIHSVILYSTMVFMN